MTHDARTEAARRWRLVLGQDAAVPLQHDAADAAIDNALDALHGARPEMRQGGSASRVASWPGDIRQYFPSSVVQVMQVMQKNALDRLGLQQMPYEPEMLAAVEPDVHLVATLLRLNRVMPNKTRSTAHMVFARVVEQLQRKLPPPMRQAAAGSLNRAARNRRPRHQDIDWLRKMRANLKHYQADYRTVIPETHIGLHALAARCETACCAWTRAGRWRRRWWCSIPPSPHSGWLPSINSHTDQIYR